MNVTLDPGSKSYWFGNNHYAFDSEEKFLGSNSYTFPLDRARKNGLYRYS